MGLEEGVCPLATMGSDTGGGVNSNHDFKTRRGTEPQKVSFSQVW